MIIRLYSIRWQISINKKLKKLNKNCKSRKSYIKNHKYQLLLQLSKNKRKTKRNNLKWHSALIKLISKLIKINLFSILNGQERLLHNLLNKSNHLACQKMRNKLIFLLIKRGQIESNFTANGK